MSTGKIVISGIVFLVSVSTALFVLKQNNLAVEQGSQVSVAALPTPEPGAELPKLTPAPGRSSEAKSASPREHRLYYFDNQPYPYSLSSYKYAVDDIGTWFDDHYPRYLEGDPDSTYELSIVAWNCRSVIPFDQQSESYDLSYTVDQLRQDWSRVPADADRSVEFLQAAEDAAADALPTCLRLVEAMPVEIKTMDEFLFHLTRTAANSGSVFGKLEMLNLYVRPNYRSYQESAKLLEEAVNTGTPRAYQMAEEFYQRYQHDDNKNADAGVWRYLSCDIDPRCNQPAMGQWLESRYSPSQLDELYWHANEIEEKLLQGEKIGFMDYREAESFRAAEEAMSSIIPIREEISWDTEF